MSKDFCQAMAITTFLCAVHDVRACMAPGKMRLS